MKPIGKCPLCSKDLVLTGEDLVCEPHYSIPQEKFNQLWDEYNSSDHGVQFGQTLLAKLVESNTIRQEKSYRDLTKNDFKALSQVLKWEDKTLDNCSKSELIRCVVFLTTQNVMLQDQVKRLLVVPDQVILAGEVLLR